MTLNEGQNKKSILLIAFVFLFSFTLAFGYNQLSYTLAQTEKPETVNALVNKGLALDKLGNYTGAIQYLAITPNDTDTLYNKGLALHNLGNYTGAIQYYDRALAIDPT